MNINWNYVRDAFDKMIEASGQDATFKLRDGTTFTIKAVRRMRKGTVSVNLTDGLQQDVPTISVMANRWDTESPGREPQKGDQVTIEGQRHAVEASSPVVAGNVRIGYSMVMRG